MVTEAGSYLRLIDSCITHRKVQGPSRTCNESKEEEEDSGRVRTESHLRSEEGSFHCRAPLEERGEAGSACRISVYSALCAREREV